MLATEAFLVPFLTTPLVVIPDPLQAGGAFNGQAYSIPKFVPILDNSTGTLRVYTVVITAQGTVAERYMQERGALQFGVQKLSGTTPLWYDIDGGETTDQTKTGLPVIVYVPLGTTGAQTIYIDETFNEVFGQYGPNLAVNGAFDDPVPTGAFGAGWTSTNVDVNGGWRSTGGNPGARFVLNSNGGTTDPTLSQTIGGLNANVSYRISVDVRRIGTGTSTAANTFGILVDGVLVGGISQNGAANWTTVTATFTASDDEHVISLAGERGGTDIDFEVDNVRVEAVRVPKYVTNWANSNPLLYIDLAGRRVITTTTRPSLVPVNQIALGAFTRVHDEIVAAGGGTDVLNVHSSGSGVGPLDVLMDTYRVPVTQLSGGVPVLTATGGALTGYHLSPTPKVYFGGERVLDPFTGLPMSYLGGEPVLDLFTGAAVLDPFGQPVLHVAGDPMLHIAGEPVVQTRGAQQTWLGGEAVVDELGNPVYNNATTPFLHSPGQAIVENRGTVLYTPGTPQVFTYAGAALTLSAAPRANDRVAVTVYAGTRIYNLTNSLTVTQFSVTGSQLTISAGVLTTGTKIAVTVAKPATHAAGDPRYYNGSEAVALGQPITDAQGNLTFDQQGNVLVYAAADLTVSRRELLSFGTGTIKLQTAPTSGLKVYVGGALLTSGVSTSGNTLTITGVTPAAGTRVIVEYIGARLHRRGEAIYTRPNPTADPGFWIAAVYAGGEAKFALGNEARLFLGGEQAYYLASDPRLVVQSEQRILAQGSGGMPGSIHYFGIDDVNLWLGTGNDTVTIVDDARRHDRRVHRRRRRPGRGPHDHRRHDRLHRGRRRRRSTSAPRPGFWPDGGFINVNGTVDRSRRCSPSTAAAGIDGLRLDDTGDTGDNTGTLDAQHDPRPRHAAGVDYTTFEALQINLGSGGDTFTIESTHAGDGTSRRSRAAAATTRSACARSTARRRSAATARR